SFAVNAGLGCLPYSVKGSAHHSETLPIMSYSPHAFGRYDATGAGSKCPSFPRIVGLIGSTGNTEASAMLAYLTSCSASSPCGKRVVLPARQAYSHSASVGRR